MLTLSLVVFRHTFGEGVASFSNLIGAGGVGVLLGILTVGKLEERFSKPTIIGGAFVVGGIVLIAVSFLIRDWSILLASFAVGLTFAWKKISVDTMVQEAIPDGYRGRVFSVYDVVYNLARVVAAALAIPMIPRLDVDGLPAGRGRRLPPLGAGRSAAGSGGSPSSRSASRRRSRRRDAPVDRVGRRGGTGGARPYLAGGTGRRSGGWRSGSRSRTARSST